MRRIDYKLFISVLTFFVFILGCGSDDSSEDDDDDVIELIDTTFVGDFRAQIDGANDSEFFNSEQTVVITEGESVSFNSISHFSKLFSNDDIEFEDYVGAMDWTFEGGSPGTSTEKSVTVTYNAPGQYAVTLKLTDPAISSLPSALISVDNYVLVIAREPDPEPFCFIETEEASDGRSTRFIYDENDFLVRADKAQNGQLQEYSNYTFDELNDLILESFQDDLDELLGTRTLLYNNDNQLINEKTEAADGTVVSERTFTWDEQEDFVIGAVYKEPDGFGGLTTFDVAYTYDADRHNVTSEIFTQNGAEVGRNNYEFDTHPKVFTGLNIERTPFKFNMYNVTSITSLDANGTVVGQQTSTFEYADAEESCGQPISEIRTTNGTEVTFAWTYGWSGDTN